jgi:hypothetical protein
MSTRPLLGTGRRHAQRMGRYLRRPGTSGLARRLPRLRAIAIGAGAVTVSGWLASCARSAAAGGAIAAGSLAASARATAGAWSSAGAVFASHSTGITGNAAAGLPLAASFGQLSVDAREL